MKVLRLWCRTQQLCSKLCLIYPLFLLLFCTPQHNTVIKEQNTVIKVLLARTCVLISWTCKGVYSCFSSNSSSSCSAQCGGSLRSSSLSGIHEISGIHKSNQSCVIVIIVVMVVVAQASIATHKCVCMCVCVIPLSQHSDQPVTPDSAQRA